MQSELITSWAGYDEAVKLMLRLATVSLRIADDDLRRLQLERSENAERLERFLNADRQNSLTIILRDPAPLRRESPRLMRLLATYPQQMRVYGCAPDAAPQISSMCLANSNNALARFAREQPRARLIVDGAAPCAPYAEQFDALLGGAGEPLGSTTLGL